MSPALAGRFSTAAPPGKPHPHVLSTFSCALRCVHISEPFSSKCPLLPKGRVGILQAGAAGETHRFRRKEPLQGWGWRDLGGFRNLSGLPAPKMWTGSAPYGALPVAVIPLPKPLGPVGSLGSPNPSLSWTVSPLGSAGAWRCGAWLGRKREHGIPMTPPPGSHLSGGLTFHAGKIGLFLEHALRVPPFTWPSVTGGWGGGGMGAVRCCTPGPRRA